MIDYEKLGEFIRDCRKDRKLTQQELAKQVNVTLNYICLIENGHKKPSLELLDRIASVFEINLWEVLLAADGL
jgi:transcriptional regulator with XRE-family HTH domain